jgi:aldose sugar dehydrogenase
MKKLAFVALLCFPFMSFAQNFIRSELPTTINTPWEITYGPDNYLWLTENGGIVSRVDPITGAKQMVYTAPDYFNGSPLEQLQACFMPDIGHGTLGLALHPDFLNNATPFIYFLYSYNSGSSVQPVTRFKVVRLTWDAVNETVFAVTDLITNLPTGYDHLGGRVMAINRNGINYLFVSMGDNGISEQNDPTCYNPQSSNPNILAQDPNFKNGKIHRFNIDGTIPFDNPLPGNSFYTRGHRNPQGLMYNYNEDILYDAEHGDRTDDEINILESGMNYGWKYVRGYHADNNFPGEAAYISNYVPYPGIANDQLKEAFYSFCAVIPDTSSNYLDWCTVAPSDGIYYGSSGIPEWTNSLLVVTLKNGAVTDQQLFRFKLNPDGMSLAPSLPNDPNPETFFAADQGLNGRLRDIAISPDGMTLYLINNGGLNNGSSVPDKITVYNYDPTALPEISSNKINVFPNPAHDILSLPLIEKLILLEVTDITGKSWAVKFINKNHLDISLLPAGVYLLSVVTDTGKTFAAKFEKAAF